MTVQLQYKNTRLTAAFPGQPGTRKVKPICILMKQEIMGAAVASDGTHANHLHNFIQ